MRSRAARQSAPGRFGGRGFTMVELLVVLLILAILLGLVVGISKYVMAEAARKQTESVQSIVIHAATRYYETTTPSDYPGSDANGCRQLMTTLYNHAPSKEVLRTLPNDAWAGSGQPLKDGFGEEMQYQKAGGRGGTPVLISKGADRQINTPDDIRSDGQ